MGHGKALAANDTDTLACFGERASTAGNNGVGKIISPKLAAGSSLVIGGLTIPDGADAICAVLNKCTCTGTVPAL